MQPPLDPTQLLWGPSSSSSVKTDLAHCVDLASLQLEAIGLLLQDHDGQLLGVDLLLHGDGHGVDVLGAALGRHLQLYKAVEYSTVQ